MFELFSSIFGFVFAIGLLTTVHEFGHFWVARRCGVKILRFSIGFGKPLFMWNDKLGTEYVIAAIPLGGYVKMLDETDGDIIRMQERYLAFNHKPVGLRIAVICAGPLANIMFAVAAYWLVFMLGVSTLVPLLGAIPKGSVADVANLHHGYEIISVNDHPTPTWEDISVALMPYLGGKEFVKLKAYDRVDNIYSDHVLNLTSWSVDNKEGDVLKSLGLAPFDPVPAIVGKLLPGYPAELAGLLPGDKIVRADDIKIFNRTQLTSYLRSKSGREVILEVLRGNDDANFNTNAKNKKSNVSSGTVDSGSKEFSKVFTIIPGKKLIEGGEEVGFVGIQYQARAIPKEYLRTLKFGPLDAFSKSLVRTRDYTILTVQFLKKIFIGKMSLGHISGPIAIAKYAGETARSGVEHFLGFLALVSISLGVLNMLPIPLLDGGHFLFCVLELLTGKPLPARAVEISRYLGGVILACLIILAMYNDIVRF